MKSIAAAGLITVAWIALCLMPFVRRWGDRRWSIAVTIALTLAYAGQALSMTLFYNGAQGDDRYQVAFVDVAGRGHFFSDYFYPGVRAHYPPLVYWVGGIVKWITGSSAVGALRWLPLLMIPAAAALIAWSAVRAKASPSLALIFSFGLGGFLVSYLTNYGPTRGLWALTILKPQQMIGACLTVALPLLFARDVRSERWKTVTAATALIAGIVATLPLYLPIALLAAAVAIVIRRRRMGGATPPPGLLDLLGASIAAALITAFYWLPMVLAVLAGNWHNNYLYWQSIDNLDPSRWTVGFAMAVPLVFGVLAARRYKDPRSWSLTAVAVGGFAIWASAWITYPLLGISFLSWWAPVPAVIALCILASRYVRDWLELRFSAGPLAVSFRKARWPAVMLIATLFLPFANWNVLTDTQLLRSHDRIDTDLIAAGGILNERLAPNETFIAGAEELLLPALSGRGLTVVPHAFYANPTGRTDERRRDVEALLADPTCARLADLHNRWGTRAIAAEVIPVTGGAPVKSPAGPEREADPAASGTSAKSLGISFLDPVRGFSPKKVGQTNYVTLSPAIDQMPCWQRTYSGETLVLFMGTPPPA